MVNTCRIRVISIMILFLFINQSTLSSSIRIPLQQGQGQGQDHVHHHRTLDEIERADRARLSYLFKMMEADDTPPLPPYPHVNPMKITQSIRPW
ncbi:hypothetical protein CARUB_v10021347mg [Capsella rubella]|uniref:Uncharacterized protein n=1 Tax=Capsella rubella TaxID=81985 RepID=R0GDI9_9BRAS|nr:hypothetical protein CARUB_v10021347mg [Capsella rubella]